MFKVSEEGYGLEGFAKALQVGECKKFGESLGIKNNKPSRRQEYH